MKQIHISNKQLTALASGVLLVACGTAQAGISIVNGDFESGIPAEVHQTDVGSPWYDYDNPTNPGNFWENAWQISVAGISPNDTAVLALSAFAADESLNGVAQLGYAYESIGTADGATELGLMFDWGSFDDAPGPRDMGITFGIYESDGSFVPDENTDILGAPGITLIDEMSELQAGVAISQIFHRAWVFDLSSAGSGELFLRINNFESAAGAAGDQAWVFVDNVMVPEPTTFALGGLGLAALLVSRRRRQA